MRLSVLRTASSSWRILGRRAALSSPRLPRPCSLHTARPLLALEKHDFQAETKNLMNIVANSLYSQREVFVRELVSNASDALEKRRMAELTGQVAEGPSEIRISTDSAGRTIVIEDTGIGMDREDLKSCLGTIAHSGSKEFIEQNKGNSEAVIGKFGVGFYSAFMVADTVTVTTRKIGSNEGLRWTWQGDSSYSIEEISGVPTGSKVEIRLKADADEFASSERVREIIRKYSYFVSSPILLNGERANSANAIWTMNPREVSPDMYEAFFSQLVKSQNKDLLFTRPHYTLHFQTEMPVSVRAVLFIPQHNLPPELFPSQLGADCGTSLYARRVLIKPNAQELLPSHFRFVVGVVDSEDIPLNLSREMLQNDPLLQKLQRILTDKLLGFLQSEIKRDPVRYADFHRQYLPLLRIGAASDPDEQIREKMASLLLFESSGLRPGEQTSLADYVKRMQEDQKEIYYVLAHNRQQAESSPYFEMFKAENKEVLFLYDSPAEYVFLVLGKFGGKPLLPLEKWAGQEAAKPKIQQEQKEFRDADKKDLLDWIKTTLGSSKVHEITGNHRPSEHPVMITGKQSMGAARYVLQMGKVKEHEHLGLVEPTLHVNLTHPLIKSLYKMKRNSPETAKLLVQQIYDNGLIAAGLYKDHGTLADQLNKLLTELTADKHKSTILTP